MTTPDPDGWRGLDRRTVAASTLLALTVCIAAGTPTVAAIAVGGGGGAGIAAGVAGAVAVLVGGLTAAVEAVRLQRTRFRIGTARVEVRSGIVVRARSGLARDRVGSVEVQADPALALLGLASLRVGTGRQASASDRPLVLRALRRDQAEELRRALLAGRSRAAIDDAGTLASLDPRWTRYAPLSWLTVALGGSAAGVLLQVSEWFGLQGTVLGAVGARAAALGPVLAIVVGAAVLLLVGTLAAAATFLEAWWAYRLEREPAGTLRVTRGLFTRRSTTLDDRRLRGVALVEPLGVRPVAAARVDAVATGLPGADRASAGDSKRRPDPSGLLPAAPRAVAEGVVAAVLREPASPTSTVRLRAHPRAARSRRLRCGIAGGLVPALVLVVLAATVAGRFGILAAVAVPVGVATGAALGLGSYRNLGHGLVEGRGGFVVVRSGTTRRRTVVLRRAGIVGWSVRQSVFQRRAGLASLRFTTAAGDQAYDVPDLAADAAATFAREAVGDLVAPFLAGSSPLAARAGPRGRDGA